MPHVLFGFVAGLEQYALTLYLRATRDEWAGLMPVYDHIVEGDRLIYEMPLADCVRQGSEILVTEDYEPRTLRTRSTN